MKIALGIIFFLLFAGSLALLVFNAARNRRQKVKEAGVYGETKSVKNKKNFIVNISLAILAVCFFVLFIFIPFGFVEVQSGEVAVVKEWGEAKTTKSAGLHFRNIVKENYVIYDMKTQQIDINTEAYSLDSQLIKVQMTVHFSIQPEKVISVANTYGTLDVLKQRIENIVAERAKVVLSSKSAMLVIETRGSLSSSVFESVKGLESQYYIFIENVVIHDIAFNEAFEQAVESKMIAEQEKLKAEYDKEKALIKAEEALEVAKKEAEAVLERAKQAAAAELEMAQAQAEAIKLVQEAWANIAPDIRETMLIEQFYKKWNGELPQVMGGDFSIFLPLNP